MSSFISLLRRVQLISAPIYAIKRCDAGYDFFNVVLSQVGMATNIPPHNLGELVDALSAIIQNPDATVSILSLSPFRSIDLCLLIAS